MGQIKKVTGIIIFYLVLGLIIIFVLSLWNWNFYGKFSPFVESEPPCAENDVNCEEYYKDLPPW